MDEVRILYEDDSLIVAFKPCGMLSEDHDRTPNLPDVLRKMTSGDVFPVHRLDRSTQGLMVYAKTARAAAALSQTIQSGAMKKTYLAVVQGIPDEQGEMTDLLYYDRAKNKSFVVDRERKGTKQARLTFKRLATAERDGHSVSLVRIRLETGRTHQIRVQFASRKMPLAGDRRYGGKIDAGGIALCASELVFPHPVTQETHTYCVTPDDGAFAWFE